ncbi:MAG: (4Fe-4S)-binding protein [Ferruginibacter sp.]
MPNKSHTYSKDGVTILWQPDICIHSGICARGLSEVFNPRERPWIDMSKAETDRIAVQVKKCPSGALSLLIE